MKDNKYIFYSLPLYLIGALSVGAYIFGSFFPDVFILSPAGRLALCCLFCVCLYLGGRILCKAPSADTKRIMKITFLIFFAVYILLLLTFTLFDPMFGRSGQMNFILSDKSVLENYLETSVNAVPFATIFEYIGDLLNGSKSVATVIINLLGNLIALTPMALFLPMFIPKCRKFGYFIFAAAIAVIIIELLQFAFVTGACDIDDLILNVFGAGIAYLILYSKPIKKLLYKFIPQNLFEE